MGGKNVIGTMLKQIRSGAARRCGAPSISAGASDLVGHEARAMGENLQVPVESFSDSAVRMRHSICTRSSPTCHLPCVRALGPPPIISSMGQVLFTIIMQENDLVLLRKDRN